MACPADPPTLEDFMNSTTVTFAGHLADSPELRFTPQGRAVARVRVAVNSRFQNAEGAWVDGATSWHTVQAWGALAEHLAESVTKGDRVLVHGRLEQREYTTEAGEKRTAWEVTAEEIGLSLRHTAAETTKARSTANV
jgi:single-strand DNA-binding protein